MQHHALPEHALGVEVEVPLPPRARSGCSQHACRAPSPPPVTRPSRLPPSPAAAVPPADAPLHWFRDEEYLLEKIMRGEALCTWTTHHCAEMRLALVELVACKKLAGPFECEESPRGKGKDRAKPQDDEGSPAGTEDEEDNEDEDTKGSFTSWGGIHQATPP